MQADDLLTKHGDALYAFARQRLDNDDDIADCIQETLLAAIKGSAGFEGRSAERTWLIGILKFKIIDVFRRRSREIPYEAPEMNDESESFDSHGHWQKQRAPRSWAKTPLEELEGAELAEHLKRCIGHLPGPMRIALTLRELEGFSTPEICKTIGVTATNLNVMLYRARLHLRRCLEEAGFQGTEN
ncbi:sigma-70 family RNA polymerase sigma factor [Turneriella parva]|uniref:RNA polymerase, sigma-24 subunit, ECF subfamily n=1 Tax=Turneriella parva (strain ATCC BAA-1111 / DSM 21527 / NCTC 11395 / H) TaxID=869212 RepID=I4B147_TURPD|nr:sigma-70 family RNA polymerase sigma factor [Turneriella parva]AFM11004.1 RNA polymerase, sigma-24 subunit, ECF subfamily [Turneriella parva DSM 21527]